MTRTTGVIMSRRTRTDRRAWYCARPLFDALAHLAGLSSKRKRTITPSARPRLVPLERREVVSETLSFLLAGFGLTPSDESLEIGRSKPVLGSYAQEVSVIAEQPVTPQLGPIQTLAKPTEEAPARRQQPAVDDPATTSWTDGVFGSFGVTFGLAFGSGETDEVEPSRVPVRAEEPPPAANPGGDGVTGLVSSVGLGGPIDSGPSHQAESPPPPMPPQAPPTAF